MRVHTCTCAITEIILTTRWDNRSNNHRKSCVTNASNIWNFNVIFDLKFQYYIFDWQIFVHFKYMYILRVRCKFRFCKYPQSVLIFLKFNAYVHLEFRTLQCYLVSFNCERNNFLCFRRILNCAYQCLLLFHLTISSYFKGYYRSWLKFFNFRNEHKLLIKSFFFYYYYLISKLIVHKEIFQR